MSESEVEAQGASPTPSASARAAGGLSPNMQGALWMIASGAAATVMTVAVRYASQDLDTRMIAFLRTALGAPFILAWHFLPSIWGGASEALRFSMPGLHLLRGTLTAVAFNFGFYAISVLPMTTATILFFLAPIFATALAVPILAERVGPRRAAAVLAGFAGAFIILRPGWIDLEWGMVAAVLGAACFSVSLLLSKIIAPVDGAKSVVLSSTVVAAVLTLPIAVPVWQAPPTLMVWLWLGVLIIASTARMYADVRGYAVGDAGFIAPFTYFRLFFIAAAGWLLFSETPDVWTVAGGAVIIGATLYIARREGALKRAPTPTAPPPRRPLGDAHPPD